jgi:hypothetical protein
MSCILFGKSSKQAPRHFPLLLIILVFSTTACTYTFTNLQLRAPEGVHSIAIAPIHDTSSRVLPHGPLWESLQREVVQSGKLQLSNSTQADVQLRVQIVSATTADLDERRFPQKPLMPLRDPSPEELAAPFSFENLKVAERYTVSQSLSLTIAVEVWDLRSRERLMTHSYSATRNAPSWNEKIPPELRFIRAEESFEYQFAALSDELARRVITDFLSL